MHYKCTIPHSAGIKEFILEVPLSVRVLIFISKNSSEKRNSPCRVIFVAVKKETALAKKAFNDDVL